MTKRSKGTYFFASFKMPDLRLEDLKAIEALVKEKLGPQRFRIDCQGYGYESVEELPKDASSVFTLVMSTHAPCVRMKLARSWAELSSEYAEPAHLESLEALAGIVKARERRVLWNLCRYSIWLAPLLGFGILCQIGLLIAGGQLLLGALYPGLGILFACYAWWVFSYRMMLFRFSRIRFE